jgi:hypothetical protein
VQPQTRRAHGGVSPQPNAPAIEGVKTLVEPRGQAPAAVAFPGFVYQGGPVIGCPQVYASFWGSLWTSDAAHVTEAGRLSQFLTDILASQFMNVLSQYGVGSGAGVAGAFVRASFVGNVPTTLTDDGIHSIIQSCIDAGVLPEPTNPSNNALIIYLDDNTGVEDPANGLVLCEPTNDTAFGYHYFFTTNAGNPFYYAIIPYLNDACLTESCPGNDAGCSLHLSETPEQRKTQVTSHEFAEMTTDPQLNAWVDPINGENGDICNGESDTITVGSNTWTVQRIYSKYDDTQSNGAIFCLAQAPNPEPRLSPGPAARPLTLAARQPLASFERLLPLPAVRFDAQTKQMTMDDLEVRRYVQKLCHPLHHSQLVPDLPGLLRQAADSLSKK